MAFYSVEVGELWEEDPAQFKFDEVFRKAPLWDVNYEQRFIENIIDFFYWREIGVTPFGRWVKMFNRELVRNIPYWNKFYETINKDFDPLNTTDITTKNEAEHEGKSDTSSNGSNESKASANANTRDKSRSLNSQTPQVQLRQGNDYASNITDGQTLVENDTSSDTVASSQNKITSGDSAMDKFLSHTAGYAGINPGVVLQQYRQSLINVDQMVIDHLEHLFMQVIRPDINGL